MASQASIRPLLQQAYLVGLMMMAVGLPLSPFLMSLSQFWLVIVWLADACTMKGTGFKDKFLRFWHNTPAVLLVAFYLMHVVGLLYTSDFQYALKDLRVKLPILVLPFIMSGMAPLDRKRFNLLIQVYVLSVFVATLFSFSTYMRHDYGDVREISHFISHIRFCLNIVFCIAIVMWYIATHYETNAKIGLDQCLQFILGLWFVYQIYIFESLSGYVILAAVVVVSAVYAFLRWKKGRGWRIGIGVSAAAVLTLGVLLMLHWVKPLLKVEPVDFGTLEKKTALGNDYWHDTIHNPIEDGRYVGLYYCRKEMQEAWPQRSAMPLDGFTCDGESLEATLARYLTSKGLRKDAEGVMALTDEDIRNIEQGVANYNNWLHPGLRARLSSTLFEYGLYRRYDNPNGGSLSQRIEYTRASFHIIRQHWLVGVGTGDVPQAFSQAYDEIRSPLKEEFRFHAHNQYLAIAVAFGVLGLAFFLFVLFQPCFLSKKSRTYLYVVFLCIMVLSMFAEDTLETQAGASMFAFFEAVLLLASPYGQLQPPLEGQKNKK